MIRNPLFRRFVIATVVFLGLFTQFQMVFACELMDGKAQYVCCCDEPGDMAMGCTMGGGCGNGAPMAGMNCCQVSYQDNPAAKATTPGSPSLQVLLLDAPQPPPIPVSFDAPDFVPQSNVVRFAAIPPPPLAGTDTYLLTNRFRI